MGAAKRIDVAQATPADGDSQLSDWKYVHERLLAIARDRAGRDWDEGRWLLAAFRTAAHARLGYGSIVEYAERLFGYAPRLTQDKLRVAEALERLPLFAEALARGPPPGRRCVS